MNAMGSQITGVSMVCSTVYQAHIKENVKTPHYWSLEGGRWIPSQSVSNMENVSIWWRHYVNIETILKYSFYSTWHQNQPSSVVNAKGL